MAKERGSQATRTDLAPLAQRVANAIPYSMQGWMGPMAPLRPIAPQAIGRQFDYQVGFNLRIRPKQDEGITFPQLRGLADAHDVLRLVIETRKDEIAALEWAIQPKDDKKAPDSRCAELRKFLRRPDREHVWDDWLRMLLEDLMVLDAPCLYVRKTNGGKLYALEPVDGATIKRVIDQTGRTPIAPDPAYQQILKGIQAVDYTTDDLIYRPRNPRTHRLYGYSPVEQIVMTINIALRRQISVFNHYGENNIPAAFVGVPATWQPAQVAQFQAYWDDLIAGDLAQQRRAKFVPGDVAKNIHETSQPALKDEYDEWIARIVCFCFSISPTPFIKQNNRATAETAQQTAEEQGLVPYKLWIKSLVDYVVESLFGYDDLEFVWQQGETTDPLEQAEIDKIYIEAEVTSRDEVRTSLGLEGPGPEAVVAPAAPPLPTPTPSVPTAKAVTVHYHGWKPS